MNEFLNHKPQLQSFKELAYFKEHAFWKRAKYWKRKFPKFRKKKVLLSMKPVLGFGFINL